MFDPSVGASQDSLHGPGHGSGRGPAACAWRSLYDARDLSDLKREGGGALTDALNRYLDAWNDHDPAGVVASLNHGGTYEDPTTGGPLSGDALAASVDGLLTG
ncbi:MAG: hypothetical protein ACHQDE_07695, partial [Acidimicrobiia bacterium]